MNANSKHLGAIFDMSIRIVAPLFQRPYVWERETNWEPLWEAIQDVADRRLQGGATRPHFLGAIVLDQLDTATGEVEARQVIDGQQRLTTLQIALAAMRDAAAAKGSAAYQEAFRRLTENYVPGLKVSDSTFKIWPTNADRGYFRAVMTAGTPAALRSRYGAKPHAQSLGHRMPNAYLYFHDAVEEWLADAADEAGQRRWESLFAAMRQDLLLVVIDLGKEDDAQVIFETLNALGTPLLPADLVKNFLFHRVEAQNGQVEQLYNEYWKVFDEGESYWREPVRQGRLKRPRIDLFLQHYLTLRMQDDVGATHLFPAFRAYMKNGTARPAAEEIRSLRAYADVYHGLDRLPRESQEGMFLYRLEQLDTNTVLPLLLELFRHARPEAEKRQILLDLESYLVRRAICGLTYKNYNRIFVDLLRRLSATAFTAAEVRRFLLEREGDSAAWPTDEEFRRALVVEPLYRRVKESRVRMLLEAMELAMQDGKTEKIHIAQKLTIEHIMPRAWREHWALPEDAAEDAEDMRDRMVHTLGNLTLVTDRLNPTMSNGPWPTKKSALLDYSALTMNRRLQTQGHWDEAQIAQRSAALAALTVRIWSRPCGAGETSNAGPAAPDEQQWKTILTEVAKGANGTAAVGDIKALRLEFWTQFKDRIERSGGPINMGKPYSGTTAGFAVGRTGFWLYAHLLSGENGGIGVGLTCGGKNGKKHFALLKQEQAAVESEVGEPLRWNEQPDQQASYISLYRAADPLDRDTWGDQQQWLHERLLRLHQVFAPRVRMLSVE